MVIETFFKQCFCNPKLKTFFIICKTRFFTSARYTFFGVRHLFCSGQLFWSYSSNTFCIWSWIQNILNLWQLDEWNVDHTDIINFYCVFIKKFCLNYYLWENVFLMIFKNILPIFVLTLRQYGELNHIILCLLDVFLFVFVLVVFGINVMLSWRPFFLSASEYIGIES